jgi:hypothetical protein
MELGGSLASNTLSVVLIIVPRLSIDPRVFIVFIFGVMDALFKHQINNHALMIVGGLTNGLCTL